MVKRWCDYRKRRGRVGIFGTFSQRLMRLRRRLFVLSTLLLVLGGWVEVSCVIRYWSLEKDSGCKIQDDIGLLVICHWAGYRMECNVILGETFF